MPKFTPVVDTEKSIAEQAGGNSEYDKHRKFDAPHALHGTKKVDRGWQQGNVGWGVLGSFGSSGKDDAAQVVSKSESSSKMIKNEKGLWVKVKDSEDSSSFKSGGRGGGVSVLQHYNDTQFSSGKYSGHSEDSERFQDAQVYDEFDYKGKKGSKPPERAVEDRKRSDHRRSPSRSPDRRRRQDSRDRDRRHFRDSRERDRRSYRDSRSRSRSPNRHDRRRRDDSRDNDRHKRSRRSRSRSNSRDKRRKHQDKSDASVVNNKDTGTKDTVESSPVNENEEVDSFDFTAVQVVNHFHEVFAQTKNPSSRITSIMELMEPTTFIASLKNENNIYLKDCAAVGESFQKTTPSEAVISKRVYVDSSTCPGYVGERVTFCLDFHRAGTAPGLGDRSKDGVLLYRCVKSHLTSIYGMVDNEKLASDTELTANRVWSSPVWGYASKIIRKDIPNLRDSDAVYHNYDHMEVWG